MNISMRLSTNESIQAGWHYKASLYKFSIDLIYNQDLCIKWSIFNGYCNDTICKSLHPCVMTVGSVIRANLLFFSPTLTPISIPLTPSRLDKETLRIQTQHFSYLSPNDLRYPFTSTFSFFFNQLIKAIFISFHFGKLHHLIWVF